MLVVALAHQDDVRARRAMERALSRLAALANENRGREIETRRWDSAIVAFRELRHAAAAAERRHSKWYRAYLHARC